MEQESGKRVHPTQKPIKLYAHLLGYGEPGDLILDPFLGSGPSLKAAEGMGRTVIGFELSPAYCDHVIEWAEAEGLTVERAP
jgi:DNA modification methylase